MKRDYIFLSRMVPPDMKQEVHENSRNNMQDAADALQWHIYNGLCRNTGDNIPIINLLPIASYPQYYKKAVIKQSLFDTEYNSGNVNVGFLNVKVIREFFKERHAYTALKKQLALSNTPKMLFLYTASTAFLKAIKRLKNKYDLTVCVIIADLPNMSNLAQKKGWFIKNAAKYFSKDAYALLSYADYFVLLTKHMAEYMQLKKPYCVMEGIATAANEFDTPTYDSKIKTVFYAGTLHRKFGVLTLLEAFKQIPYDNYRLVLCGAGDSENDIKEAAANDSRIKFYGQLPRADVLKLQSNATVLVNPRQNNEEFTRYSFPSKNLEYLSSGIPFIAYKLDGIPDEYDDYILYVEDNDVSSLTKKLIEVCQKPAQEREDIGTRNRAFVSRQKNELVQTQKILSFIKAHEQEC